MEAALRLLRRDGVLAGLNISEVAKEVGVTPANVYHYFGSRQGLLRSAINHRINSEIKRMTEEARARGEMKDSTTEHWFERARSGFDFLAANPELGLAALLALDGDKEFRINPRLEEVRAVIERDKAAGYLFADLDPDVMYSLFNAAAFGFAVFGGVAARQLGLSEEEFQRRSQAVIDRAVLAFVPQEKVARDVAPAAAAALEKAIG
jgi:AcrR family transcriptional regulator